MIGETILHYKILEKLGEGGMGEVYKAQDTKLDRFVALKFLPSQLTASEDDKARFIQEAKAASAMNHPNVCTIYSIEEYNNPQGDKQLFISMEYVEGKTLKDKKDSLSEKQKLEISVQVAEGLAAAHEKGIVHRDIKPENIMIRKDGIAQIMDFGLAKLYSDKNASRLTKVGTTMGTLGYMSPEQIQGLDVDHRTDIFSFGIVLYEMFAGESPFKGMHETAIIYEIVNVEAPPLSSVKQDIDPELDRIILECLEKEKDERCQSAKELAKDLRKIKKSTGNRKSRVYNVSRDAKKSLQGNATTSSPSGSVTLEVLNKKFDLSKIFGSKLIPWIAAIIFLAIAAFLFFSNKPEIVQQPTARFSITLPDNMSLDKGNFTELAISKDGKKIVYGANHILYLRDINNLISTKIAGTDNALSPFFSPDGNWIAYFSDSRLIKIPTNGGSDITLDDKILVSRGGDWGDNGELIFPENTIGGLSKVSETGGKVTPVTEIDSAHGERTHRWPQYISEFNTIIYTVGTFDSPDYYEDSNIEAFNLKNGQKKVIVKGASSARYLKNGYLVYSHSGILYAEKFDISSMETQGQPVPVVQNISGDVTSGAMNYSISDNGTLVYFPGNIEQGSRLLVKINSKGEVTDLNAPQKTYLEPRISPDGKKIAVVVASGKDYEIWIFDIQKKSLRKLTFGGNSRTPTWSPDSKRIAYWHLTEKLKSAILIRKADGSDSPQQVYTTDNRTYIDSWSRDSKYLVLDDAGGAFASHHLIALQLFGGRKTIDLYPSDKGNPSVSALSPDGKWLAFQSSESGQNEIYVRAFPSGAGKWQISNGGGNEPHWSPDGKKIYYFSDNKIMMVPVSTEPTFSPQNPVVVFTGYDRLNIDSGLTFDISPDGKYFISTKANKSENLEKITVVTNWFPEIERLVNQKNNQD